MSERKRELNFTRADFIDFIKRGSLALLASQIPGEFRERLVPLPTNTAIVDFAPSTQTSGIIQNEFFDNDMIIRQILGSEYVSKKELLHKLGLKALDRNNLERRVYEQYPKVALVYGAFDHLENHGSAVAQALCLGWKMLGRKSTPYIIPIQEIMKPEEVHFPVDDAGNMGLFYEVNPNSLVRAIAKHLKRAPMIQVINFSLQMGPMGFYFVDKEEREVVYRNDDGRAEKMQPVKVEKTYIRIEDAYTPDKVWQNIRKLMEVCSQFPHIQFVAAAGNVDDDLTDVRKLLDWYKSKYGNLSLIGEWIAGKGRPRGEVYGADFYVENHKIGLSGGSSISAPVISSLNSTLLYDRIPREHLEYLVRKHMSKKRVYRKSNSGAYTNELLIANVVDPSKFTPL
jgi:hypothetical protein